MSPPRARGFTLLELLVVIFVIALLSGLLFPALGGVITKSKIARCRADIQKLSLALAAYKSDTGEFPHRPAAPDATSIWQDQSPWLYAALRHDATAGGGPGAPYVRDWNPEDLGWVALPAPDDGDDASTRPPPFLVRSIADDEIGSIWDVAFQRSHAPWAPGRTIALAFLDPWGNPYRYREWMSVPDALKSSASRPRTSKLENGETTRVSDRPRVPNGFEIWSSGPNGTNEWGKGDDISSF